MEFDSNVQSSVRSRRLAAADASLASRTRSAVSAVALGIAIVAATTGPAPTLSAQPSPRPARFAFETRFRITADGAASFDRYWASVRELGRRGVTGYRRHVYAAADGLRLVTLPVERLAEYGSERRNEQGLRAMLGVPEADAIIGAFGDAQVSRSSYIRQYEPTLSLNPERLDRAGPIEVTSVTVAEQQEQRFERVWRRAMDAYRLTTGTVIDVSRTLVGGGPQFIVTRSWSLLGEAAFDPAQGLRAASGERAAADLSRDLQALVVEWKTEHFVNLGLDSDGGSGSPR